MTKSILWLIVCILFGQIVSVTNAFSQFSGQRRPTSLELSSSTQEEEGTSFQTTVRIKSTPQSQQQQPPLGEPICQYFELVVDTQSSSSSSSNEEEEHDSTDIQQPQQEIITTDLTSSIQQLIQDVQCEVGTVTVISKHTTTTIAINEYESRLVQYDIPNTFLRLIPPDPRSSSSSSSSSSVSKINHDNNNNNDRPITYRHNDIELRPDSDEERQRCIENGWDVVNNPQQLQAWRDQEPINAHSHLVALTVGSSSECIPINQNKLVIGQWQSIMLIDLDGPRSNRIVGVHIMGYRRRPT